MTDFSSPVGVHGWRALAERQGAQANADVALAAIERLEGHLRAFTCVLGQEVRQQARALDALPVQERGPLFGVPVAVKDENDLAGTVTTFGTFANSFPRAEDSLTVARLRRAGALLVGKTTMPAFGAFPFTESQAFGLTLNPHHELFTPGGSSGGSAVAVAANLVPLALGGDGGGSIRIPAAHCGLVGFKPARGTVPTTPYQHLWHDLGVAGPLAQSVADAELFYRVISGGATDELVAASGQARPLKIALKLRPDSALVGLHPEHRRALWSAARALEGLGHRVELLDSRTPDPTLPFAAQFFAGLRDEILALDDPAQVEALHRHTRLLAGWVSGGVLAWAKTAGEKISARLEEIYFEGYDLVLTATTASRPARVGQLSRGGFVAQMVKSVPSVAYTLLWNVSGHPALALPAGRGSDGLPLSIQLVASRASGAENLLFAVGAQLEAAGFGRVLPPGF